MKRYSLLLEDLLNDCPLMHVVVLIEMLKLIEAE